MSNLSSSHKVPVIVGRIPVVGTGAVGEHLVVNQLDLGISTQITPRILEDWQGEGVQLTLQTAITSVKDLKTAEDSGGIMDRFDLGNHTLDCNSICKFAEPMILGSMSAIGLRSGDLQDRELAVVVRITR